MENLTYICQHTLVCKYTHTYITVPSSGKKRGSSDKARATTLSLFVTKTVFLKMY